MRVSVALVVGWAAVLLAGCGNGGAGGGSGGGGTSNNPTITSVTASCTPTSVVEGGSSTCSAVVTGTGNYGSGVSWTASAGTITSAGAFTAPNTAETVTVTATSTEDPTKSGTASITVTAPTITSVAVTCSPASVVEGGSATCSANVKGAGSYSSSVSWSASAGSITSAGVFTAPNTTGSVTVTATSTEDSTKSGSASITVTAPVIAVTISPSAVSVPSNGTQQFTATVTGTTGSQSTAVTWTTTAGTISSSGLLSLQGVSEGATVTVTATSVADPTKSASATVTVTQRVITISWGCLPTTPTCYPGGWNIDPNADLAPEAIPDPMGGQLYPPLVYFTGAEAGDILTISDFSESTSATLNSQAIVNGEGNIAIAFCPAGCSGSALITAYDPHVVKVQITSADGTIQSNELWKPLVSDQTTMALSTDGSTVYFAPGMPYPVEKYATANGSNTGTLFGTGSEAVAVDDVTGDVVTTQDNNVILPNQVGSQILSSATNTVFNNSYPVVGTTAIGGYVYATQPNLGQITKLDPSQMSVVASLSDQQGAGNYPYSLDSAKVNGTDTIAVYSGEDTTIRLLDGNLSPIANLPLTGITKVTAYPISNDGTGGWPLKIFQSGKVAFLSIYDQNLVIAELDSSLNLTQDQEISMTNNAIGLAKDETHQAVIVWGVDIIKGITTMESVNLATGAVTPLTSPSTLPAGFEASDVLVSPDGTKLYVGGINPTNGNPAFYILNNQ